MIPVSKPFLGDTEIRRVSDAVREGWISSAGPSISEFEKKWAERCNRDFGVAVANGTVALQLAVRSLGLSPGDEIIMPAFTIISCALAAIYNGCVPVLVDCEQESWCMDVTQLEDRIGPRTRAIMPVHIYGHPVDMDPILYLADKHDLAVIEDAAEAHGAKYHSDRSRDSSGWKPCGGMGTLSTFSFYANKLVTTGEGGMLLTDDDELADSARSLRNLAFGPVTRFAHTALGFNFRMTNIQAALGLAQLERFDEVVEKKRSIAARYIEELSDIDALQLPSEAKWAQSVFWMFGVVIDEMVGRDVTEITSDLEKRGVQTRPFFLGLHQQAVLQEVGLFHGESYPETERISKQGFYLPSGPNIHEDDQLQVVSALRTLLAS